MKQLLVPQPLKRLLIAATGYLPALALSLLDSQNDLSDAGRYDDKRFYLQTLAKNLTARLSSQESDCYILARVQSCFGELLKDSFHWLIGFDPRTARVEYISPDLYVYDEPSALFDVTEEQLARLPQVQLGPGVRCE